ncbi:MAG TPA: winged helix-turn-helix domain-containing protein [Nitrosopumilaceae archaeon]|nr:winged helix-turn-helix domain-containing protein [Nitrosopumilaceae archaeon]
MAYRNTLQIIGDILETAHEHGVEGANASRLLTKANLSYKTYQGFMNKLLQTGLLDLVQLDRESKAYVLTEKGRVYLSKYEEFELMASSLGLFSS